MNATDSKILILEAIDKTRSNEGHKSRPGSSEKVMQANTKYRVQRNVHTNLWYLRYEDINKNVPLPMQIQFTTVKRLLDHFNPYFAGRNVKIKEIIEVAA